MALRKTSWRQLAPGIIILAAIAGAAIFVLTSMRVGALRGEKFTLYTTSAHAGNLIDGSEVWLSGIRVGTVKRIFFAPPTADTSRRLILELEVLSSYRELIRLDARTEARAGARLIGSPVLHISTGSPTAPPVAPGDTIRPEPVFSVEVALDRASTAFELLPEITENARTIAVSTNELRTALTSIFSTNEPGALFRETRASLNRLVQMSDRGTFALILRDTALFGGRVTSAIAAGDSLMRLLESETTTIGRFRRDTTLVASASSVTAEMAAIRQMLEQRSGTLGRMEIDPTLKLEFQRLSEGIRLITEDIRRNPFRYMRF